ncbi:MULTISPECIES: zinc ribbon domain-containing protein [unclassified Wenzhouxiangella]|uniref:zinc ribbon domain-containing protein n=1 Tax=unclassified Wenzhouxiangella TaxID=2613841 RepID=UPI000E32BA1E|nr:MULTISPECIES: zinc ribbon domain-containing protein [unclassified Wenzhouxiangella]RFF26953.1 zinc ribbon domain-containing protein [Wenzhouxiangella sp. 15181]RFP69465.1 zinc ribbon domain-containing protein [Wenzhouxiangella sp. 15190]
MAITTCPDCKKRISDQVNVCPHCDAVLGELTEENLARIRQRRWSKRVYLAKNLTYLGMTLVIVGAIWWWMAGWRSPVPQGAVFLIALGFLGYLVSRGWLFWLRLKRNRP